MTDPQLLRVRSIQVDRLFDLFDHRVDLKLEERVTILHGPNGVGKTMLLRMVNALLDGRYSLFQQVPFRRFVLELTDDSKVELTLGPKKASRDKRNQDKARLLHLTYFHKGKEVEPYEVPANKDVVSMADAIAARIPWVNRAGDGVWTDERAGMELLAAEEIVARYRDEVPIRLLPDPGLADPVWLKELRDKVNVHLIAAQRLLRVTNDDPRRYRTGPRTIFTVLDYARDVQVRINDTMARYGQQSQSLDQSFPQRLLNSRTAMLPAETLKQRMEKLDARRADLKEIGLLDEPGSNPFDTAALSTLDPAQQSVMALYVEDTEQKLSVLDDLARRARLLLDNVNRKFHHKHIRIDRELGLVAEGEQGRPLALDALSSGEQHELVLHYDLLFRVRPNTLVLIDEPELSLHVAWQKRFLPDLLEIVETAQFDVLMATHSPFIVGDRSDLMIGLDAHLV
ncbi:AAA family ATPase [Thiocystis violascens]|uniref:NACHT domain protein n=1 Tax=Thiocystis violascens (strain ATCC 17096 / DSM 198 / 6111) TaxID=765911 RepID=I3Y9G2_THIV6|nr:AAA family ATPase [Thiocystis violascens]AFL73630.1 NACHT domain protein [Thiocystis violascens DSM 198]